MCTTETRNDCQQEGEAAHNKASRSTTPNICSWERSNPPAIMSSEQTEALQNAALTARQRNILWVLVRVHETSDQTTSYWTGFNILTSEHRECTSDAIGYLPKINAPATEFPTVQDILRQSVSIRSALQHDNIAVVFNQALYAYAI